jgi:fatty-acyl-CoA synthase
MMTSAPATAPAAGIAPGKAWLRALELTAPIPKNPGRILSTVVEERAQASPDAPALVSDGESLTYAALAARANRYTRWALDLRLGKGDTVALVMPNRPEYMAVWLGITRTGCTVALVNPNLAGRSLAHSLEIVEPKHIISEALQLDAYSGETLRADERRAVTIADRALYIYTSGTTGMPKAASVSHGRLMQWSHWFAGLMGAGPADRMYNCLPMYHSVGGVLATGAMLVAGGSVAVRDGFSASQFWNDVVRWDCTLFQYIGELCRYLLHTRPSPEETGHRVRMGCGNGLRPDIWREFQARFGIPRILEFYAATEGVVSLFNVEGAPGSIGRIPPYLAHRFPVALVRFDVDRDEPVRDEAGFCIPCARNEAGEALGPISGTSLFDGYTSPEATRKKILHDVFEPGDAWFRTGDLMRRDENGYYYFVDRIGDTFRWKGENVATSEVAEALAAFPGIRQACVYGVAVAGVDGRAGMAALAADESLDLARLRTHLRDHLPEYAHPLFLRIRRELDITGTFKFTKHELVRDHYDPAATTDAIWFHDRECGAFVPLTPDRYARIQAGEVRL